MPRKQPPWLIVSIALAVACLFAWLTQGFLAQPEAPPPRPASTARILGVSDEASLKERAIEEEAERRARRPPPPGFAPTASASAH